MNVLETAKQAEGYILDRRRYYHQHPELSGQEKNTSEQLVRDLEALGITEIHHMKNCYGLTAVIRGSKPGKLLGIRSDMDALPIREETGLPFASQNEGVMHACGHDSHMAILLGAAKILQAHRDELCGGVKLIFQPAEEGVRGAQSIAEGGILDDVDIFLTSHLGMGAKTGELVALSKGFLSTRKADAVFHGLSAHAGASPQDGKNAILAACAATLAMHTACQDSRGASRINVGTIHGGSGRNVVADTAVLQLETRGETTEIEAAVYERACRSIEGAAAMFGCTSSIEIKGSASSADSDKELETYIAAGAAHVPEITRYIPESGFSGSEDAAYLMARVQAHGGKAAYMCIGSDIAAPHHNDSFNIDERSLFIGLKLYLAVLWEILSFNSQSKVS